VTDARASRPTARGWWSSGVAGIGAASLLSDAGHEIPTSLLPGFLTSTLGAPAAALGLIEGIADGLAGASRLVGGAVADDPARRRIAALAGYGVTPVLSGLIGAATAAWQVGALRAGAWTARGFRVPSRNALLADLVPPEAYGRAYGFERAMDNLGAILGPVLALALVAAFDVRTAIYLSAIPGLLAVVAIGLAIRKIRRPTRIERRPLRLHVRPVLRGDLGRLMATAGAFEVGNVAATLLILRATELLGTTRPSDEAVRIALLLYVGYNVSATLASIPAGHVGDRAGARRAFGVGILMFLAGYLTFAATGPSVPVLAGAFLAAGIGIGFAETAEHAAVATAAPESIRGSAFGVLAAIQSFGNLAASAVAGLLWTAISPAWAFGWAAALMTIASFLLLRFRATNR